MEYGTVMVSHLDRQHFRRIAEMEAKLNHESMRAGAACTPGENIAFGFYLSEFAASFGGDASHPDEVPPIRLWRARKRSDTGAS